MTEKLDSIPLDEVLEIYNEISVMLKSLEDKKKELTESE